MRPCNYMYRTPSRDEALQILPPLEHFVIEMNKLNSKERKIPQSEIVEDIVGSSEPLAPK